MTTVVILAVGLTIAVLASWWSIRHHGDMPAIDPESEKRWLVRVLADRPRVAAFVTRRLDRSSVGGLLLTGALAALFVLGLFAGWVFDSLDESRGFAAFDESVAKWGAENATTNSTAGLKLFTALGGTLVISVVTAVVAAYAWWRYRSFHVALFMISVSVAQTVLNNGLKMVIERERPSVSQLAPWAGSSFPSGHTAAAAATYAGVALVLGLGRTRRVRALLGGAAFFLATAVGATRALLGVHWLTDVLAGLAVGWLCFIACAVAFGGRVMQFGEPQDEVEAEAARPGRASEDRRSPNLQESQVSHG